MWLDWVTNEKTKAISSMLGENSYWILAGIGCFCFSKYRKEKREEKKSLIAEEALNFLESSISQTTNWLLISTAFFVINKHSPVYAERLLLAPEDRKKQMLEELNSDPYEVNNFVRSFNAIFDEFIRAKNRAARLNDVAISDKFEKMHLIIKKLQAKVARYHRIDVPNIEKEKLSRFLSEKAPEEIEQLFESTKVLLNDVLLFQYSSIPKRMRYLILKLKKLSSWRDTTSSVES
jgi:hypothetical protein